MVVRFFNREGGHFLGYVCFLTMLAGMVIINWSINIFLSIVPALLLLTVSTALPTWYRAINSHRTLSDSDWAEQLSLFQQIEKSLRRKSSGKIFP